MTHDHDLHDDQMVRLMERAMLPVTADDELVAGGISRGRRATRRRRTTQATGFGAAAMLLAAAAVAVPSLLGGSPDDQQTASGGSPAASASTATDDPTVEPAPEPSPGALPPHVQRAQELLQDALPDPLPDPGAIVRVTYDPDGRGRGEILAVVSTGATDIVGLQAARCERVAASPAADNCVDTGAGWVFTGPSLPDLSGIDADLAGVQATYILRDGSVVDLTAYNAVEVVQGGDVTRTTPVLDVDDLRELATETEWFG